MKFSKYQALGNDYIVISPDTPLTRDRIQRICSRYFGIGSDGILMGPLEADKADFALRIFNPDGSEAEKSGNGLRIFARFLWDRGVVADLPFTVDTPGGPVVCQVGDSGRVIRTDMGRVRFDSISIPMLGLPREVLMEEMDVGETRFKVSGATIGNPHCIVHTLRPTPEIARRYGPMIETDTRFPRHTNVQFMAVMNPTTIKLEIWERGAGYTLASGSSAAAAAAVSYRLGLTGPAITVEMPGGRLRVEISEDFSVTLTGPAQKICHGSVDPDIFTG